MLFYCVSFHSGHFVLSCWTENNIILPITSHFLKKEKLEVETTYVSGMDQDRDALAQPMPNVVLVVTDETEIPKNEPSTTISVISLNSNESDERNVKNLWQSYRGYLFAIFSGLLLTLYSFLFKFTNGNVVVPTILLVRGIIEFSTMVLVALISGDSFTPTLTGSSSRVIAWILVILAAVFSGTRLELTFFSLEFLDMSAVHVILNSAPVLVAFLSICCLKEKLTKHILASCLCLLIGLAMIFGPSLITNYDSTVEEIDSTPLIGFTIAIFALIFTSFVSIFTRMLALNAKMSGNVITAYSGISIIIHSLITYSFYDKVSPSNTNGLNVTRDILSEEFLITENSTISETVSDPSVWPQDVAMWLFVIAIGVSGMLQNFTFFMALQYESPARVTMARSFQMIISWKVDVIQGKEVEILTLCGILVIMLAIFISFIEKEKIGLMQILNIRQKRDKAKEIDKPETNEEV